MIRKCFLILSILLLNSLSDYCLAQQNNFLKDYLERWETSRAYMLAVAEAMPESDYNFKPTPEEMTFAQQLMHIAAVVDWHGFSKADGQEFKPRLDDFKVDGLFKKDIIDIVNREFARATKLIAGFNPSRLGEKGSYNKFTRTRQQFFLLMSDHVTHHRAQMLVYLRLKGITPPKYIEFQ